MKWWKFKVNTFFPNQKLLVFDNIFFPSIIARVLTPPAVKYRGQGNNEVVENVSMGKWTIRNRFHSTPTITKWAIYHFGPRPNERIIPILQEFEHELPTVRFEWKRNKFCFFLKWFSFQLLRQYGIFLNTPPIKGAQPPNERDIETTLRDAKNQSCQIVFVVLNDVQPDVYNFVKLCGNQKIGLVTQCVSFQSLQKNSGKLRMCKDFSSFCLFPVWSLRFF